MNPVKSMTAFARHTQIIDNDLYVWELRSVNHRYLDAHFRLPVIAQSLEQGIRKILSTYVTRGRVDINLSIKQDEGGQVSVSVNQKKVALWLKWQQQIQAVIPDVRPLSVMEILGDSEVFEIKESAESLDEVLLMKSFESALGIMLEQRTAEGGRMHRVLAEKLEGIAKITRKLKQNMSAYEQVHQLNWQARVEKLHKDKLDDVRLHQELALLISKADVTEELDRLDSHVSEFESALQSNKPVGRRLDFLLQEFNREANTLGSKSIHQDITRASVELKVLIDQLREQVQNIE
jgi:uncharacterized protein (TIGR00255 family)